MDADKKRAAYRDVARDILAVVDGESSLTARMATAACLLSEAFEHYFWTGFYVVDPAKPDELIVGPYQGSLGCLRIPFGQGVCGVAAQTRETQLVDDVNAFPGHIACDARSRSEIVVPVVDAAGDLVAVFDVDAETEAAFDGVDREALESLMARLFAGR